MTGDKSRFLSLEAYDGETVTFGENMKGEIIAKGRVGRCIITRKDTGDVVLEGVRKGNTYVVDLNTVPKSSMTCLSVIEEDPLLWHKRLGHASFSLINTLRTKDLVRGLPSIKFVKDEICDPCTKGKQVRSSFKPKNVMTTSRPLELIHMDLCGPMRIQSRSGKSHNFSAPRTPQQNGVVERKNRTLEEMARTMLIASGIKPNISHFRVFGCKCFVHVNGKRNIGKFDERSDEAVFLGYSSHRFE
ncbi:uncharacterized protein LOC130825003 [Amaranthus tricolor]|uniref:uncharacterized protein LOC130825003 n=1 Tax=Amaranthus tricolor TaxID=29722 RepID=UPI0025858E45|nr:uncharacterized protein LOC130825003 [Amaranthus tricolor]